MTAPPQCSAFDSPYVGHVTPCGYHCGSGVVNHLGVLPLTLVQFCAVDKTSDVHLTSISLFHHHGYAEQPMELNSIVKTENQSLSRVVTPWGQTQVAGLGLADPKSQFLSTTCGGTPKGSALRVFLNRIEQRCPWQPEQGHY